MTTVSEEQRRVIEAGLGWLFDTAQPDGSIVSHHGITLGAGDRRYYFIPRGIAGRAVIVVNVANPGYDTDLGHYTIVLEPDELTVLTGLLAGMGYEVVDTWNGHPAITGSLALARPVEPSLLAAVDRYHAGCPDNGSVFCDCGWYAAGNRMLVQPARPVAEMAATQAATDSGEVK